MHFHLPKPLHGWREFLGEVGIIVLGVLIALAAEQAVEAWRWQEKVAVVRKSIMGELANDRARWEVNMADSRCALQEIEELNLWAEHGAPGTAPQLSFLPAEQGFFWMHSANWSLATSSQALDHFPVEEQLAFASLYDGIAHREVDLEKASDLTERVLALIPLAADPQTRRDLRVSLGDLRSRVRTLVDNNGYMQRHFDTVGVKPDRADFAADLAQAVCR
jgi:hypothetical protein